MTMSSAPTAELPVIELPVIGSLVGVEVADARTPPSPAEAAVLVHRLAGHETVEPPAAGPCRADIRAERRLARRRRRRHAAMGFAVLLGTLGATVAVLDVLH